MMCGHALLHHYPLGLNQRRGSHSGYCAATFSVPRMVEWKMQ